MNYPIGYEAVKLGEEIKNDWLHLNISKFWEKTVAAGCRIDMVDLTRYCRPTKHHDPKYSDLILPAGHRLLKIGEVIKERDLSYKYGEGPWVEVVWFSAGVNYNQYHHPMCRPFEQPTQPTIKETPMLMLELEVVPASEVNINLSVSSGLVFFRIIKQEGFVSGKDYKASNGINIGTYDCPEFFGNTFCLRGALTHKNDTILIVTNEQFAKIKAAVKEILERENKPKFIETITFFHDIARRRFKVNVISRDDKLIKCVDCDTKEEKTLELRYITDISSLPNAF